MGGTVYWEGTFILKRLFCIVFCLNYNLGILISRSFLIIIVDDYKVLKMLRFSTLQVMCDGCLFLDANHSISSKLSSVAFVFYCTSSSHIPNLETCILHENNVSTLNYLEIKLGLKKGPG